MPFPLPFAIFHIWDVLERGRRVANASTSHRVYLPLSVIVWPSWVLMQTVPGHRDDNPFNNPTNNHPFSRQRDRQACDLVVCTCNHFETYGGSQQQWSNHIWANPTLSCQGAEDNWVSCPTIWVCDKVGSHIHKFVCMCVGCWLGEYPGVDKMISWTQSHVNKATHAQFDIQTLWELGCFLSSSPWQVWEATDLSKLLDLFTITEVLPTLILFWFIEVCLDSHSHEWQDMPSLIRIFLISRLQMVRLPLLGFLVSW